MNTHGFELLQYIVVNKISILIGMFQMSLLQMCFHIYSTLNETTLIFGVWYNLTTSMIGSTSGGKQMIVFGSG